MCIPLGAATGGLSAVSGVAGIIGGAANNSFQKKVASQNRELAARNAALQNGGIQARISEAEQRAFDATRKVREDALRASGRVQAAAGEAGIKGGSVEAVLQEFARQEGRQIAATELNAEFARAQGERDLKGVTNQLQSNLISSAGPGPVDFIGQSLGVFGQAFNATLQGDEFVRRNGGDPFLLPRG